MPTTTTSASTCRASAASRRTANYRGEQYDSDLGLYYLRARYYNPTTGRFMSRDPNDPGPFDPNGVPTDPKKWHKYLYAGGDPVNRLDSTGRDDTFETLGVLADKLNFYNNANFNNRGGQCQAYVYRGFGLLLDPRYLYSPAEEELIQYVTNIELSCDINLVKSAISALPESPTWNPE